MNQVLLFGILCIFCTMIGEILSLNYVSEPAPNLAFFPRAAVLPQKTNSSPIDKSIPDFPLASILPRKTGRAYTILYPLTFENRGGKSLNITLQQPQPPADDNQVQSRIMNQPKPYPAFQFDPPLYNKPVPSELPPPSSDEYDDSDNPSIGPSPPSKQYNVKPPNFTQPPAPPSYDKSYQPQPPAEYNKSYQPQLPPEYNKSYQPQLPPEYNQNYQPQLPPEYNKSYQPPYNTIYQPQPPPPIQYNLKSPRFASFPSPPPAPQPLKPPSFDKNVAYIAYLPRLRYNKTKSQPRSIAPTATTTTTTEKPIPPPFAYNKNTVPKYKILPLQAYNKATFVPRPVIPPTTSSKVQQQFVTCICVPYYLCKDGVINAGGRLQATNKRKARSLKYDFLNKTLPAISVQPKTAGAFTNVQTADPNTCQQNEICCQIYFSDNTDDADDGNYYPVATPPPEPSYPTPPRYPDKGKQSDVCGVRKVYGVQRRLKQLRYTADVAEFGEYPWQVAILKKNVGDRNLYLCGGVLIAPQWIATVAHCIKKDKTSPLLVRLGEWDVNRKDEDYPYVEKDVTTIVLHPQFDPESLENDLALIRIIAPVDQRIPHITPACLPFPNQVFDNQKCWVTGWGKDFFGPKGSYQNVLKEVDVPVVSRALCSTELRSTNLGPDFKLHPGFLCAGGEAGKDACTGDGGSPLVCTSNGLWYVVGLVSWGIGCGQPGVPGVYVNVLYYADWINSITRR